MKARISKSHLAAAILCIGLVTGAGALVDGDGSPQRIPYRYTMEEGDTIYSVAARIATPKENINELTWRILEDNHIEDPGAVQPGTEITIYVDPAKANIR
ncbi:LysM domain-containing protein [uncultured Dialister sp.]|uniref:LysM peptidoglycan-binding domain-containing protein n=1 Tax=uncultured Dialister sp. TaxID=278064 RepID=UPI0026DB6290|nr:LysM domain-containing protein [uncultured Dialister sp.]